MLSPRHIFSFDKVIKLKTARSREPAVLLFVNALKLAMSHAARGAEGGESRSQDADDDLQESLPRFFLHNARCFELINPLNPFNPLLFLILSQWNFFVSLETVEGARGTVAICDSVPSCLR